MRPFTYTLFCLFLTAARAIAAEQDRPTIHDTLHFDHNGQDRQYYMMLPPDLQPNTPLIVVLHGMGGQASKLRFGLGLNTMAAERGYAVVYPQALDSDWGTSWNAGFPFTKVDDVGFLTALAQELQEQYALSASRTHVLGISVGGYMAYHLACHATDTFRTHAIIIGAMSHGDSQDCAPSNSVSILHLHGTKDPLIPYDGFGHAASGRGGYGSVPKVIEHWVAANAAQRVPPELALPDTEIVSYKTRATGQEITLISMLGFGHDWPNETNSNISAAQIALDFFDRVPANQ